MTLINLLWRKGEPNFYDGVERVLEIWTGKLNDVSADGKRGAYTCKIPCTRAKGKILYQNNLHISKCSIRYKYIYICITFDG